jgi:NADH dehydrogenase
LPQRPDKAGTLPAPPLRRALHRPALFRNNTVSRLTEVSMRARIYQPARTAMQSGTAKTKGWTLDFMDESERGIDPLMGWTSSGDMQSQVRLAFDSREAAEDYARERGIDYVVTDPKPRKPNIRPRGYGENFASDRKGVWTH